MPLYKYLEVFIVIVGYIEKRRICWGLGLILLGPLVAQAAGPVFRDVNESAMADGAGVRKITPLRYRTLVADMPVLRDLMGRAPQEGSLAAQQTPLVLSLPWPDGSERRFRVEESSILAPELAAKFPELRTYVGQGVDDRGATARLDLTPLGFHAQVLSTEGAVYIDPYRSGDVLHYQSYWKRDLGARKGKPWQCDFDKVNPEAASEAATGPEPETPRTPSGGTLRTYRLAMAATGEYTTAVCAPNPAAVACGLAAIVISVNRVVGVYEHEFAIRMVLVANNNLIVYTSGGTDPYTNNNGVTMLGQNQTNLDAVIGTANYDVGHVFSTGGGGVANLRVPCTSSKARGVTGLPNPEGDDFDIDFVAHEMGHQFGGDHTFNGQTGNCSGNNRSASSAYEPGSGSTIMAYAGICGAEDLQPHSDPYFHVRSFDQIVSFSNGTACDVETATGNTIPTIDAGASFTIPKQTPFTLTSLAGVDPDGDTLSYNWEEFDLGTAAPPNTDVLAVRPIFRSFTAVPGLSRTFPRLSDILNNTSTLGESLPTRNRTMTFRMTVRDNRANGGGVDYDSTTVVVDANSGPFTVTDPDTAVTWFGGSVANVGWNVAGTAGAPVNCANVEIRLSIDGGQTFPTVLNASTPNDGAELVNVPVSASATARVKVGCVGNIFFDLSNTNFAIVLGTPPSPTITRTATPTNTPVFTATSTATVTASPTATFTETATPTDTPVIPPTSTPTDTPTLPATSTPTATPSSTRTPITTGLVAFVVDSLQPGEPVQASGSLPSGDYSICVMANRTFVVGDPFSGSVGTCVAVTVPNGNLPPTTVVASAVAGSYDVLALINTASGLVIAGGDDPSGDAGLIVAPPTLGSGGPLLPALALLVLLAGAIVKLRRRHA